MNRRCHVLAILLLFLPVSLLSATIQLQGQRYTDINTIASRGKLRAAASSRGFTLSDRTRNLSFTVDKRDFRFNNVKYHLNFPVAKQRGVYYLSDLDRTTILEPLLNPSSLPRYRILNIVIDPGHGGHDNGASGKKLKEKNLTLQIARRLQKKLSAYGYRATLTRDKDVYLSLPRRSEIARQRQADLFLSIHINAAANTSVKGIECFAITPAGAPSTGSKTPESRKYPGNSFGTNSLALAAQIQRSLLNATRATDRGVKCARFQVLREIKCPGALIEVGFISNRQEETRMGQASYQEALAQAICNAVVAYGKSTGKNKAAAKQSSTTVKTTTAPRQTTTSFRRPPVRPRTAPAARPKTTYKRFTM